MVHLIRKSLKHKAIPAVCCVLSLIGISCDKQEIYYRFHEVKNTEWAQDDTLVFDIDSTLFEVNVPYKLSLEITNNVNYPYQNIWFFVQSNINDTVFAEQSKEYLLADEFGKWKGSGFGSLFQSSLPLDNIIFKEKKNYQIKLEHGMRDASLKGVEKVGVKIRQCP